MRQKASVKTDAAALLARGQEILLEGGDLKEAARLLAEALDALGPTTDAEVLEALELLAQAYLLDDEVEASERVARELVARAAAAGNREGVARGTFNLGRASLFAHRYEAACEQLTEAAARFRALADRRGEAQALRNLGDVHLRAGRAPAARDAYGRARRLFEEGRELDGVADTLTSDADALLFLGQTDAALAALAKAARAFKRLGDARGLARVEQLRGEIFYFVGKTPLAARATETARALLAHLGDRRGEAHAINQQGRIHFRRGRDLDALAAHEVAAGLSREIHDPLGLAHALSMKGEVLLHGGRIEEALAAYGHAEELYTQIGDRDGRANMLHAQGFVAFQLGREEAALGAYEHAARLFTEVGDSLGLANTLVCQGRIWVRQDALDRALAAYDRAADLFRRMREPVGLSDALVVRSRLLARQGSAEAAVASLHEAIVVAEGADDALALANALAARGRLSFVSGEPERARRDLARARRVYRREGALLNLARLEMDLASRLQEHGDLPAAHRAARRAFRALDGLRPQNARADVHADLVEEFADALVVLLGVLRKLDRISDLVVAMESRRVWTLRRLGTARQAASPRRTRATTARQPGGGAEELRLPSIADRLRAASAEGAVVVAWYPLLDDHHAGCLLGVPGRAPLYVEIALRHEALAAAAATILELGRTQQDTGWTEPLAELGAAVLGGAIRGTYTLDGTRVGAGMSSLGDVLQALPDAALAVVPQGLFGLLPWATLPTSGGRRLVEERRVYLLPQLTASPAARRRNARGTPRRAFCFGLGSAALHWTEREASEVAGLLEAHGYRVATRIGREAADPRFADTAKGCRVVHLATHAVFDAGNPFRSFLDLGGRPDAPGRLTLMDLLALDLAGATAVLSACSTAVPDWRRVFDPVSLSNAFLAAGCERALGTLWPVDDASTAGLMTGLYRHVLDDGLPWEEALRRVQLAALRGLTPTHRRAGGPAPRGVLAGARTASRRLGLASPLRWGAFVLSRATP